MFQCAFCTKLLLTRHIHRQDRNSINNLSSFSINFEVSLTPVSSRPSLKLVKTAFARENREEYQFPREQLDINSKLPRGDAQTRKRMPEFETALAVTRLGIIEEQRTRSLRVQRESSCIVESCVRHP